VIYQASAFLVFQKVFETITQAPGVQGWEYTETHGGIFGIGGSTFTITYGNSGSWTVRQSDRAAGFIRAETSSIPVVNFTSGLSDEWRSAVNAPVVTHAVTVAVSGPDETGPTQVVVTVSTMDSVGIIDHIYAALDSDFQRVR
jgi:hypothetical protein